MAQVGYDLNTSYVKVQFDYCITYCITLFDLNTSYVKVQYWNKFIDKEGKHNLNTSYVKVQYTNCRIYFSFFYI